ncbi:DUF4956 domain-containing protein [Roseobacter sp. EG26]|uniref:DUF4956 domain-containing protein n=1 Tax=Roseobacter sp. EG26 TaxID=3412477 RepID=UPI002622E1CD|nr:DUF4956 domain-containing protein [uncultured Roseobacter sp.]
MLSIMFESIVQEVLIVCLLISISLAGRAALIMAGQRWVGTFAHTATLTTLPIITFVITKVISGNIALSLGMIGALSIVRFRNPVKSPFELSVYFAAITMGIAASVSVKWLVFFVAAMGLALVVMVVASILAPRILGRPYFETSFSEGNRLSTLEVEASAALHALQDSEDLISEVRRDGAYSYILASNKFTVLQGDLRKLEGNPSVIEARLNK